jgi:hypothetical protein
LLYSHKHAKIGVTLEATGSALVVTDVIEKQAAAPTKVLKQAEEEMGVIE